MYKKMAVCAAMSGTLLLGACAGFQSHQVPEVNPNDLQFTSAVKTKVFTRWVYETEGILASESMKTQAAAFNKKTFEDVLKSTNCCDVVETSKQADVIVDGKSLEKGNPAALVGAVVTGLSLYTVPSWVTSDMTISAAVKTRSTKQGYELHDATTLVQWLPMMFVFPFSTPASANTQMNENAYKTIVVNMKNDGFLK